RLLGEPPTYQPQTCIRNTPMKPLISHIAVQSHDDKALLRVIGSNLDQISHISCQIACCESIISTSSALLDMQSPDQLFFEITTRAKEDRGRALTVLVTPFFMDPFACSA